MNENEKRIDFKEHRERVKNMPTCDRIKVLDIFHLTRGNTVLVCKSNDQCNVIGPADWDLYRNDNFITKLTIIGIELGNDLILQGKWGIDVKGHIDKTFFDFNTNMELRRVVE